jgi:Zn-dependent peptidase ImmA (M78 family)/transcriptional regulator with XRE-family HTH domain
MPIVNPNILVWARETSGYTLEEAAKKLNLRNTKTSTGVEKLQAYEEGKPPSRPLLVRMAKQYRRPLLTFYLREPPRLSDRGEDYRVLANVIEPEKDAIVDALVRRIKARQSIIKAALISEGDSREIDFIGSYEIEEGVPELVTRITQTCGFHLEEYRRQRNQTASFKYLRSRIESVGIFTILAGNLGSYHTNLSVDVFRGFALSDPVAPFVVINDQDAKAAWSFTLLHEVAHLWLGATGISGGSFEFAIERFCNEVASHILLPQQELMQFLVGLEQRDAEDLIPVIDEFAVPRRISSLMVAYRLYRQNAISEATYSSISRFLSQRWQETKNRIREQARTNDGGPDYYVVRRFLLGDALTSTARRMLSSGQLSTTQVSNVLGVRALKVGNLLSYGNAA